jgi:mono/diheme cytochrome c family protein
MSSVSPQPPRTPLTVKIAYAQLVLAALALTAVPIYALKKSLAAPESFASAPATLDDESGDDSAASPALASSDPVARGEALFGQSCAACHQANGEGIPGAFPPLAKSDYLLADRDRAIGVVLRGLVGPVTVNGVNYESAMPPMPLDDTDTAAVLTYVLQAWGNQGPAVSPADVARVRAATPGS